MQGLVKAVIGMDTGSEFPREGLPSMLPDAGDMTRVTIEVRLLFMLPRGH